MKKLLLVFVVALVSIEYGNAQNNSNTIDKGRTILQEYIAGVQSHADVTALVVGLKDIYGAANKKERQEFKDLIVEKISEQLSENQEESVRSLINFYMIIADSDDEKLPMLFFIRGNMYAAQKDSTNLKNVISSLERCAGNSTKSADYLYSLNEYLEHLRNYVPVTSGIEGMWISDVVESGRKYSPDLPKYIVEIIAKDGKIKYKLKGSAVDHLIEKHLSVFFSDYDGTNCSQIEKEFGEDSLYIFWSSEKISNTDLQEIALRRYLAGAVGTSVAVNWSDGNANLSSQLAGNMMGGLTEMGINMAFDALFAPKKRIFIVEAWLKRVHRNMFEGVFSWKETKVSAYTDKLKFDETSNKVTLMRWTNESDAVFMAWWGQPYAPYEIGLSKAYCKKNGVKFWKDVRNDINTKFGQAYLRYKKAKKKSDFLHEYNCQQMEKIKNWCIDNQ